MDHFMDHTANGADTETRSKTLTYCRIMGREAPTNVLQSGDKEKGEAADW